MTINLKPAVYWIKERESIRELKEEYENDPNRDDYEESPPRFTDDPILRDYRFCNVRREDDRVTVWIRENIRKPYADHPLLWLMLCLARQINWPRR